MPEKLGEAVLELTTDATRMIRGMSSALAKADAFGKKLSATGRKLSMRLTLPLIAAGGASIKMAADFEKSMSEIVGLVGISQEQVSQWSEQIKALGPELGKSPKELADAMFFITSAGLRGADALETLTLASKASAAGMGETKVIADAMTSAMNAYGIANLSAAEAIDTMVATVREGKVEAAGLAGTLGKVIPIASAIGVEFNEVGAALAALTRIGADAATGTTALRAVMTSLLKPTTEAEDKLVEMGTSSAELRKKIKEDGLLAVLFELKEKFGDNTAALTKVFPNVRALTGVLGLLGDNSEEAQAIWDRMQDTTGANNAAFEAAEKTLRQKLNKTMANFKVALVEVGEVLGPVVLPFIQELANHIKDLAVSFKNLSPQVQRFALIVVGLAAALGPMLIITGSLIRAYVALRIAVAALNTIMLANPWAIALISVAALTAALWKLTEASREEKKLDKEIINLKRDLRISREEEKTAILETLTAKLREQLVNLQIRKADAEARMKAHAEILGIVDAERTFRIEIGMLNDKIKISERSLSDLSEELGKLYEKIAELRRENKKLIAQTSELEKGTDDLTDSISEETRALIAEIDAARERSQLRVDVERAMYAELARLREEARRKEEEAEQEHQEIMVEIRNAAFSTAAGIVAAIGQMVSYQYSEYTQAEINYQAFLKAKKAEQYKTLSNEEKREWDLREAAEASRREMQREAAIKSKRFSLFEAFITGAQAIINGFATKPFLPLGLAMGALATALTAAQITAIASKPIPAFAEGVDFMVPPGYPNDSFLYHAQSGERVQVTPENEERAETLAEPMQGDVYLDGRKVGRWMQKLFDDQDILLNKGAYAR